MLTPDTAKERNPVSMSLKSATTPCNAEPQSRCDELAKVPLKGQPWPILGAACEIVPASCRVLGPAVLGREPSEQVLIVLIVSSSLAASPN